MAMIRSKTSKEISVTGATVTQKMDDMIVWTWNLRGGQPYGDTIGINQNRRILFQNTFNHYVNKHERPDNNVGRPDIIIASESLWVSRKGFPEFTNEYNFKVLNDVAPRDQQVIFYGPNIEFIGHVNLSASNYPSKHRLFINILRFIPANRVFLVCGLHGEKNPNRQLDLRKVIKICKNVAKCYRCVQQEGLIFYPERRPRERCNDHPDGDISNYIIVAGDFNMELKIKTVEPATEEENGEFGEFHQFLQTRYTICPYSVDNNYEICRFDNVKKRLTCIDYILAKMEGIQCQRSIALPYTQRFLPSDRRWSLLENVKQLSDHPPIVAWLKFCAPAQASLTRPCNYCDLDVTTADQSLDCISCDEKFHSNCFLTNCLRLCKNCKTICECRLGIEE